MPRRVVAIGPALRVRVDSSSLSMERHHGVEEGVANLPGLAGVLPPWILVAKVAEGLAVCRAFRVWGFFSAAFPRSAESWAARVVFRLSRCLIRVLGR